MVYGVNADGRGRIELTPEEKESLEAGRPLKRRLGNKDGLFELTVSIKKISSKVT